MSQIKNMLMVHKIVKKSYFSMYMEQHLPLAVNPSFNSSISYQVLPYPLAYKAF